MRDFFVEQVLTGNILIAAPIALLAGFISFASPCVLPLVPGYLGYVSGTAQTRMRLLVGSSLFVLGFSVLFISYGALFGQLGANITANRKGLSQILGLLTIFFGLIYIFPERFYRSFKMTFKSRAGLMSAPFLGFMFGLGWTPCIGSTLGAVQTLAVSESSALRGALLSLVYCIGLGTPFLLFALFLDKSQRFQRVLRERNRAIAIVGGAVLLSVGVLQFSGLWDTAMINLRNSITEFVPVL